MNVPSHLKFLSKDSNIFSPHLLKIKIWKSVTLPAEIEKKVFILLLLGVKTLGINMLTCVSTSIWVVILSSQFCWFHAYNLIKYLPGSSNMRGAGSKLLSFILSPIFHKYRIAYFDLFTSTSKSSLLYKTFSGFG